MDKKNKRRAATAAVAAAMSASVLVGGVVDDPGDLLDEPDAVILDIGASDELPSGDGEEEEERRTLRARCRGWVLSLPWGVRALVGVPLWAAGTAILALVQLLWGSLLSPLALRVLVWALAAVLLLAVFAFGIKTAFPKLPLRKILKRHSILPILGGVCVVAAADAVLELVWDSYAPLRDRLCAIALAVVLILAVILFGIRAHRREKSEKPEAAAETMDDARRRVLAMADAAKKA